MWDLGFRDYGLRFRVQVSGCQVWGLGFRIGAFRVLGFEV